jgi:hypothetical protein
MPNEAPLQAAHFFDKLPISDHRAGDIWLGLPTFGLLPTSTVRGVVITPACDLANRKCEALTFLPIVSASHYLGSIAFRYDCWLEIEPLLARIEHGSQLPKPARFELISSSLLEGIKDVKIDSKGKKLSNEECDRILGYLEYVRAAEKGVAVAANLEKFIKADRIKSILARLVTNSLKSDIHFLPGEGASAEYSPTPSHSVVLFRYPLTVPIDVLDKAQNSSSEQWQAFVDKTCTARPFLSSMQKWPIKLATIKNDFFADMISRYLNMHIRLGSIDFQDQTVRDISEQIKVQI